MIYSLCRLKRIFEEHGYRICGEFNQDHFKFKKSGCFDIHFWEESYVANGWIFEVNGQKTPSIMDAINLSKEEK